MTNGDSPTPDDKDNKRDSVDELLAITDETAAATATPPKEDDEEPAPSSSPALLASLEATLAVHITSEMAERRHLRLGTPMRHLSPAGPLRPPVAVTAMKESEFKTPEAKKFFRWVQTFGDIGEPSSIKYDPAKVTIQEICRLIDTANKAGERFENYAAEVLNSLRSGESEEEVIPDYFNEPYYLIHFTIWLHKRIKKRAEMMKHTANEAIHLFDKLTVRTIIKAVEKKIFGDDLKAVETLLLAQPLAPEIRPEIAEQMKQAILEACEPETYHSERTTEHPPQLRSPGTRPALPPPKAPSRPSPASSNSPKIGKSHPVATIPLTQIAVNREIAAAGQAATPLPSPTAGETIIPPPTTPGVAPAAPGSAPGVPAAIGQPPLSATRPRAGTTLPIPALATDIEKIHLTEAIIRIETGHKTLRSKITPNSLQVIRDEKGQILATIKIVEDHVTVFADGKSTMVLIRGRDQETSKEIMLQQGMGETLKFNGKDNALVRITLLSVEPPPRLIFESTTTTDNAASSMPQPPLPIFSPRDITPPEPEAMPVSAPDSAPVASTQPEPVGREPSLSMELTTVFNRMTEPTLAAKLLAEIKANDHILGTYITDSRKDPVNWSEAFTAMPDDFPLFQRACEIIQDRDDKSFKEPTERMAYRADVLASAELRLQAYQRKIGEILRQSNQAPTDIQKQELRKLFVELVSLAQLQLFGQEFAEIKQNLQLPAEHARVLEEITNAHKVLQWIHCGEAHHYIPYIQRFLTAVDGVTSREYFNFNEVDPQQPVKDFILKEIDKYAEPLIKKVRENSNTDTAVLNEMLDIISSLRALAAAGLLAKEKIAFTIKDAVAAQHYLEQAPDAANTAPVSEGETAPAAAPEVAPAPPPAPAEPSAEYEEVHPDQLIRSVPPPAALDDPLAELKAAEAAAALFHRIVVIDLFDPLPAEEIIAGLSETQQQQIIDNRFERIVTQFKDDPTNPFFQDPLEDMHNSSLAAVMKDCVEARIKRALFALDTPEEAATLKEFGQFTITLRSLDYGDFIAAIAQKMLEDNQTAPAVLKEKMVRLGLLPA